MEDPPEKVFSSTSGVLNTARFLLRNRSVSSVIECFCKTQQPERALQLFQQCEKAGIVMMKDVYFTIAKLCDTEKMWRLRYKEQLKDPVYRDYHK